MNVLSLIHRLPFPINITNQIWVFVSVTLLFGFLMTYVVQSKNVLGSISRYLVQYGKYKSINSKADIPKSYFTHFYIWASIWNSFCLITVVGICFKIIERNWIAQIFFLEESLNPKGDQLSVIILMILVTIQSYRRLHECLFVSVYSSKTKITLMHYLWGFGYYTLLAPTLISECLALNKLPFGELRTNHVIGIVGFLFASYFHHQSHVILADLRKKKKVKADSHGIPEGGLFNFISCPHYFSELLIYISFWIIIYQQCVSWCLVVLHNFIVHFNLAAGSHLWYKETFPSYPKHRKALIPFIY